MASANTTQTANDKLIIFKGDDTGGMFGRPLLFTIYTGEGVSLDGCRAEWEFDGIVKRFDAPLIPGEVLEVFYSHNETRCMELGVRYGTFRIIDAAGKVRTFTNTKPVEVTNNAARCYPGSSAASVVVNGIGDVKHSEFADLEEKEGMTLNEVGGMVNTLIRKLKGTVSAFAALLAFGAFADGAITPQTDFGDISPTSKIGAVLSGGGAIMSETDPTVGMTNGTIHIKGETITPLTSFTETDPTVPAWAKQPNPPEGMTDNALVLTNGAVKTANGLKTIGAADFGALATTGGVMTGDLTIKDNTAIRFKTYDPDFDAGIYLDEAGIRLGDAHTAMVFDALSYFYLNTKTSTGWEGIYFNGQRVAIENWQSLSKMLDSANANNLAINKTFSNAVLSVGLNIDTNSVAVLNEIADTFGGFPIEGTATTVGGLLAALAAAVAWLKKNKVGSFASVGGASATVVDGVAKLDDFFTESNSLLNARITYERNATGLKDRAFNTLSFDGTEFNLSTALEAVTPTASGQPRDLLIVATATAATTISFTAGTIKGDKPTIDGAGTWLITLTEYAANTWYCRQIKMEDAA